MSNKRIVATSNVSMKPNAKLNLAGKVEENKVADLKSEDESLFASNLTNIIQGEASGNPSPLLKQHIMDLLQEIPDIAGRMGSFPADEHDSGNFQQMQGLRLFQFTKQEEVDNILKEQISNLKRDLDMKNTLIEKVMKENNNLKNEIGELLSIEVRTKKTADLKAKESADKINQLQEEIKSLKLELNSTKQNKTPTLATGNEFNQLKITIESYHEDHSKKLNSFVSQLNNQVSDFMQDIKKKHEKLNNQIQDFKKHSQTTKPPVLNFEKAKEQSKIPKPQVPNKKVPSLKDERTTTPKARINKVFKKEPVLRSFRTFEFDDDLSITNQREKCLTARNDNSFELRSLI